jgi:hypothetical protein
MLKETINLGALVLAAVLVYLLVKGFSWKKLLGTS